MTPSQVWFLLNEINGKDDADYVGREIIKFSNETNMELVKRWDVDDEPPEDWDEFEQLWLDEDMQVAIKAGNGILLMWSKDSDTVFPYIWWYIGYNKKGKRFESSAWMTTGDFLDINTNVITVSATAWNGITLNSLDEERCAQMLEFNSDWSGEMREGIATEWANCATGLNVWKVTMSLEEIMGKTLNWSNANIKMLLGD